MQLRAIIVDDEETGIDTLKHIMGLYVPDVKVIATSASAAAAIELIEDYRPDIVFLDINMPEMDGFGLLDKLHWRQFCLIFTTAHQEFALKALKQDALDYLLKPIDYKELQMAVNKAIEKLGAMANTAASFHFGSLASLSRFALQKLAVSSKFSVESVGAMDIVSIESKSNYTLFTLNSGKTILSPKTLNEYKTLLCDNITFMRVHHSFIINLHYVQKFLKSEEVIIMNNGQKINLARSKRNVFTFWLHKLHKDVSG